MHEVRTECDFDNKDHYGFDECTGGDKDKFAVIIKLSTPQGKRRLKERLALACSKEQLINDKANVFDDVGKIQKEHKIQLANDATPTVNAARRTPDALKEPLRHELDRLIESDIIKEVQEPTDRVNNVVLVTKSNGSLPICLDPRELNKFSKRPHYYAKTLGDILPDLKNAKYF
ncbi:uncharacterized protein [Ptychodera flava]|uniref:uncharacterized protein n=1 Tax=Ptychodera flava TaxID=63121 RepID=UPI00396A1128